MAFFVKITIYLLVMFAMGKSLLCSETAELQELSSLCEMEKIVTETRILFENHEVNRQLLQSLYHDYNPGLENLNLFVEKAEELFPYLNCGLATVYLRELLKTGRIINGNYKDNNHTFLLLENDVNKIFIIDITADQYGGPSIYVGPLQAPWTLNLQ